MTVHQEIYKYWSALARYIDDSISGPSWTRPLTRMWLPLAVSLLAILPSTICFTSRCNLLPKSLNMVEPPESTMFYQTGKIKSMFALVRQRFQQSVIHTTHLVKPSSNIDRTGLNDGIDDLGQGSQEVRRVDLRVEEDLGGQESLVADVHVITLKHTSIRGQESAFTFGWELSRSHIPN